jgi:hypothetical protein
MATYNLLQQDLPVFSGISTSFGAITASIGEVFSYMWLLGIVACLLAGAAIVAIGGLRLTAADSGNKAREIKEDIVRATYGVIGVLALWLILYQVNPDLLRGEISFKPIDLPVQTTTTGTSTAPGGTTSSSTPTTLPAGACVDRNCPNSKLQEILADEQRVRGLLSGKVETNNNSSWCTRVGQERCTNVGLLPGDVISMLTQLRTACNCTAVVVSGGTEWWAHSTHGPGVSAVDIQIGNSALDAYIKRQPTSPTSGRCAGGVVYVFQGWRFCNEGQGAYAKTTGAHWHVNK